jgi:hypothetical protein
VDASHQMRTDRLARIRRHWRDTYCSACGQVSDWVVPPQLFGLGELKDAQLDSDGMVMPVIAVACRNCGHTILMNALASGVLPRD